MVAAHATTQRKRRIVCTVVRVPEDTSFTTQRHGARPSDLVPWADPYIAGLVRKLQQEVRQERTPGRGMLRPISPNDQSVVCDLDPPSPLFDPQPVISDWTDRGGPQWPVDDRCAEGNN